MWSGLFTDILTRPWARRSAAIALVALTIMLVLFNLRRARPSAPAAPPSASKHLERTHAIQRQMLEAASRRPRNRDDLLERLREGGF